MPIKKAAFKHLRQAKTRTERNRAVKKNLSALTKKARLAIDGKNVSAADEAVRAVIKALDKAAQHGVVKKQTVARKKSRLMKRLHAISRATPAAS